MQKRSVKKATKKGPLRIAKKQDTTPNEQASETAQPASTPGNQTPGNQTPGNQTPLNTLKQNLSGKRKAIFEILDDVKKVKPEQWQDANQVEQLAKNFASKLGLPVPEQRIKQFVSAYKDATKNGPNANVDDLVQKYGNNVDDKTLKEIKKFVPKSK